jgi:hypothetical protein
MTNPNLLTTLDERHGRPSLEWPRNCRSSQMRGGHPLVALTWGGQGIATPQKRGVNTPWPSLKERSDVIPLKNVKQINIAV